MWQAADPHGVLNRGCKMAAEGNAEGNAEGDADGDVAIGPIKYDPDAAPIDPRARVALDDIEKARAWHRFRLTSIESLPLTP